MHKIYLVECTISNKQWIIQAVNKRQARDMIAENKDYGYDYFDSGFYVNELFESGNCRRVREITRNKEE